MFESHVTDDADFRVTLSETAPACTSVTWSHDFLDPEGKYVTLTCERMMSGYRMHFPGIATVVAMSNGRVFVYPQRGVGLESVRHVLLDQALPRLLALRGGLVLHAAVVSTLAGKTLLLIGDSGRGKSTLTGAFLASGRRVANDDGAVVSVGDAGVVAVPTYPSLRLLPDSRAHLFADQEDASLAVADYSSKRRLPVPDSRKATHVGAIVLLAPPLEVGTPPRLTQETPGSACMAIIRNGFQLDLSDTANLQVLLAKAAEAARLVPVYQLHYPRQYEALPDVIDLLEREA